MRINNKQSSSDLVLRIALIIRAAYKFEKDSDLIREAKVSRAMIKEEFKEMDSNSSSSGAGELILPTRRLTKSELKSDHKDNQIKYYRRPSTNIPFIPSLRILKRDIRRKYVEMLSNVMNSHDVTLFSSFIDEFCHPNFSISHSWRENTEHFFKPLSLTGRDNVKTFLSVGFYLVPDGIEIHSDSKICKRLYEGGSRIIGSMEKTGTLIYLPKEINGIPVDRNNSLKDCLPSLGPPAAIRSQEDLTKNFQLSQQPLRARSHSSYEIVLDENHCFLTLHMYFHDLSLTPISLDQM